MSPFHDYVYDLFRADDRPNVGFSGFLREKWPFLRRIYSLIFPHLFLVILSLVYMLLVKTLSLLRPLIFLQLIDYAIPEKDIFQIEGLAIAMVVIHLIICVIENLDDHSNGKLHVCLEKDIKYLGPSLERADISRLECYTRLQRLSSRFFISTSHGEIIERFDYTDNISQFHTSFVQVVEYFLPTIELIRHTFLLSHIFAHIHVFGELAADTLGKESVSKGSEIQVVLLFPAFYFPAKYWGERLSSSGEDWDIKALAVGIIPLLLIPQLSNFLDESLSLKGMMIAKLFGLQNTHISLFRTKLDNIFDKKNLGNFHNRLFWNFVSFLEVFSTAIIYGYGGLCVARGQMTAGELTAFASYLGNIHEPLTAIVAKWFDFVKCTLHFEKVFEMIDLPVEIQEKSNAISLDHAIGHVQFSHVSFDYQKYEKKVNGKVGLKRKDKEESFPEDTQHSPFQIRVISFDIEPGKMCAIVGHSGAGKSTLISLLLRLYDVTEGSITIDGIDLRDIKLSSLSKIMSIVPQDSMIFNDSIRNNISMVKQDSTEEELFRACKIARIYDTIVEFPQGFETRVGNEGFRLSGGEKQRVAIARAVLADPRILLLDEATSSLDSINEELVQDALAPLFQRSTCFVIAHRLSTILRADAILVLERVILEGFLIYLSGSLVESGTHEELLAKEGVYSRLYRTQFKASKSQTTADLEKV